MHDYLELKQNIKGIATKKLTIFCLVMPVGRDRFCQARENRHR